MGANVLVITNGDSAASAIQSTRLELQHVLPWRDVLHEGPVPGDASISELRKIRARYLAQCGYGDLDEISSWFEERDSLVESCGRFDEVVLWFEHDLYDQLQLIQVLARLQDIMVARVSIVCEDSFVGQQEATQLGQQFQDREPVASKTYVEAEHAWSCFTSSDPTAMAEIAGGPASRRLPHLAFAFRRLIGEYPDRATGLSMTEDFILRQLDENGLLSGKELFREYTRAEQAEFMGDWSFFRILVDLATPPNPLLGPIEGATLVPHVFGVRECADQSFRILPVGRRVVRGEMNALGIRSIDRWIGGVHLVSDAVWMRAPASPGDNPPVYSVLGPVIFDRDARHSSNLR